MKRLFAVLFLVLFVPIFAFGQQSYPPDYGWKLIYNDTLGQGTKSAYSWTEGGTQSLLDTTAYVDFAHIWGASTIWLQLDSLTGYSAAACTLWYQLHNREVGDETTNAAYAGYYNEAADFNQMVIIASTKFAGTGGSVYYNLSADNTSHWAIGEGGRFAITVGDTAIAKLWMIKH